MGYDNFDDYYFPTKGAEIYAEYSLINDLKLDDALGSAFLFNMRKIVSLSQKVALILNLNGRALLNSNTTNFKRNVIGGEDYEIYLRHHLPFVGISMVTPVSNYAIICLSGFRFNLLKNHFLTLKGNVSFDNNDLWKLPDTRILWGTGLIYAIKSGFGSLEITAGYSNFYKKPTVSFNLGYWF